MFHNFKSNYLRALQKACNEEEKQKVEILRNAQLAQRNMDELEPQSYSFSYEYTDLGYYQKLYNMEPVILANKQIVVANPQSQVRVPIEKVVGVWGARYALCHIFINKNFFEYGEIANISVHIDNSRVGEDCSLAVAQLTKIYYKLPREATRGKKDVYEHQWLVQKEVKGPLCAAGEKKSMLIKFGIGKSKPNDFELRMDSELDENEYEYKEQ